MCMVSVAAPSVGVMPTEGTLAVVARCVTDIEGVLAEFEPGALSGPDAVAALDLFAKGERLCAYGKAACAARATAANAHRTAGVSNPVAWLAKRTGDSVGQAADALSSAQGAKHLPHLDQALRRGELSPARGAQVAQAASARPAAEPALVELAKQSSMRALRERCAQVRAGGGGSGDAESARHAKLHRGRYLRHWSGADGAFRLDASLTPEDGAKVLAGIEVVTRRIFDAARRSGMHESHQAYAADALVAIVSGEVPAPVGPTGAHDTGPASEHDTGPASEHDTAPARPARSVPPTQVSVRVDAGALRRGYVKGDECCEIPGVGPVSVASARALLGDAWLKVVITDGEDIASVCHLGRTIPAHLRSAVIERDQICVVPGCEVAYGLEIDHWRVDYAEGGPTCLDNLARLCHAHHLLKTHHRYAVEGGPGHWRWVPPHTRLPPGEEAGPPGRRAEANGLSPPGEHDQPHLF